MRLRSAHQIVDVSNGKLVHELKDHSDAVYSVAFNSDGTLLASGAADRAVKVWDVATGKRLFTLSESTDWVYAVAWNPANKQLAAAGWIAACACGTCRRPGQDRAFSLRARRAVARLAYSSDGKTLYSLSEDRGLKAWDAAKMVERTVYHRQPETPLALPCGRITCNWPSDAMTACCHCWKNRQAKVQSEPLPVKPKIQSASSPSVGDKIVLPATIDGVIGRAGQTDFYRFDAKAGQEIGVQLLTSTIGSKLDPLLQLTDSSGHVLIESTNGLLGYRVVKDGVYAVGIRDREYRGDATMTYRLSLGDLPVVTSVFPLGVQRGTETEIHIEGVNLGETKSVRVKAPVEAVIGTRLPIQVDTPKGPALGAPSVVVGEFAEVVLTEKGNTLPVPGRRTAASLSQAKRRRGNSLRKRRTAHRRSKRAPSRHAVGLDD